MLECVESAAHLNVRRVYLIFIFFTFKNLSHDPPPSLFSLLSAQCWLMTFSFGQHLELGVSRASWLDRSTDGYT